MRAWGVAGVLALCGIAILALVQRSVGTEGFLAGVALAVLPVPVLVGAFLWVERVEPEPRRNLFFAFGWGSCAATLIAIFANGWLTDCLDAVKPGDTETLSLTVVAPFVEEMAKGAAVLLLFLFRRQDFDGIVDGVAIAGLTATGFAFTENILYLGHAFGEDLAFGNEALGGATTTTFFMRVIVSPFAHPLFTCMTGLGFALATVARRRWVRRYAPFGGLVMAMVLHGVWNGSSVVGTTGFVLVYAMFMFPVFGMMVWLSVWSRNNELKTVGRQLPVYAAAGWISPFEPVTLSSMKARKRARELARGTGGEPAVRTMRDYQALATSLAFLRARAVRRGTPADFAVRERALLHSLWNLRPSVQSALAHAAFVAFAARGPVAGAPGWGVPVWGTGPGPGWGAVPAGWGTAAGGGSLPPGWNGTTYGRGPVAAVPGWGAWGWGTSGWGPHVPSHPAAAPPPGYAYGPFPPQTAMTPPPATMPPAVPPTTPMPHPRRPPWSGPSEEGGTPGQARPSQDRVNENQVNENRANQGRANQGRAGRHR